jgi:cysteine desulfuration protein SufE
MAAIIASAPDSPALSSEQRSEDNRIRPCTARAWVQLDLDQGLCRFRSHSDAPIVAGLLHLICLQLSGLTPDQVAASTLDPISELGLHRHLSPTRIEGAAAAIAHMKRLAHTAASPEDPRHLRSP